MIRYWQMLSVESIERIYNYLSCVLNNVLHVLLPAFVARISPSWHRHHHLSVLTLLAAIFPRFLFATNLSRNRTRKKINPLALFVYIEVLWEQSNLGVTLRQFINS